jgi:hypothetical protein
LAGLLKKEKRDFKDLLNASIRWYDPVIDDLLNENDKGKLAIIS